MSRLLVACNRTLRLRQERPFFTTILSSMIFTPIFSFLPPMPNFTVVIHNHAFRLLENVGGRRWDVWELSDLLFCSASDFVLLVWSGNHGSSISLIATVNQPSWLLRRGSAIWHIFASEAPSYFRPPSRYLLEIQSLYLAICPPQISFLPLLHRLPS